ncbi:MAG: ABC transporter permease [Solobacterium sp.]|nr:ABC transporter permease [Solobacterium sp.]
MKRKDTGRLAALLNTVSLPVIATILGLLLGALIMFLSGHDPLKVYSVMFDKSFINVNYLNQTLTKATPVIMCGISGAVAWRAGHINLGIEGQMVCGGITAIIIGLYMPGPAFLVTLCACIGACAAGALYALIPTFLQDKSHVSLIMVTLMMNYIANYLSTYLVSFPLKDTSSVNANQTMFIDDSLKFTRLFSNGQLSTGFILSIMTVIAVYLVMNYTSFGYESKMSGFNPYFAKYGGVRERRVMYLTMALSGAVAGFAGFVEVFGTKYRYSSNMIASSGYAWTGLMASLVGQYNPFAILFYSIFFSGLTIGGQALQRDFGIPLQIADIITSSIMLFVSINIGIHLFKAGRKQRTEKKEETGNKTPAKEAA